MNHPRTDRQAHGLIVTHGLARVDTERHMRRVLYAPPVPQRDRRPYWQRRAARLVRQLVGFLLAPSPWRRPDGGRW